uniref:Uncharacterized protein n=1 Tax=Avena sativa TaxID=4498 RepID=A0ACD5X6I9_AVESA
MPTRTSTDAAKMVVVTPYEELPRRRPGSRGATSSSTAKTRAPSAVGGGYNRRAVLLAYAQHLRRRGGGQRSSLSGPRALGWGEWKRADLGGASKVDDGDRKVASSWRRRRSWCCRLRLWVRIWTRTFFRRVRTIGENASCKKVD